MNRSIRRNYVFATGYQIFSICVPLITTPYVSRVLRPEGIGAISYTAAIFSYILLFGTLGVNAYAMRQVAFLRENKKQTTDFFGEILSVKLLIIIPALLSLGVISFVLREYRMLLLVHVIDLLGSVIGIDWLYHGFEDFAITTKRNFVVKMIGIVCVFLFVKDKNDAVIYVLIQSVSSIAGAVVMWFGIKRYIDRAYVSLKNFRRHYSGILSLFLVQISGSVYMYLDKIMIGTMTDIVAENGYYEQAQKIINLSTTIITSLSTVLQPRISNAFISSDTKGISHYMEKSLHFVLFLGTPMTLGLIACSSNLVPWFLGKDFLKSQELLYICAPIIIIHSIYNVFGYQYLLGTKQDRVMTLTILGGSGCNVVLNALFIPRMLSVGASIASVAAEFVVMLLQILYVRKQIAIPSIKGYALKCLAAGVVMFVVVVGIGWKLSSGFLQTMGLISVGAGVYFWMMFFFKNDFVMEMVDRIKTGTRNVFGKN